MTDLNRRPSPCKGAALPTELIARAVYAILPRYAKSANASHVFFAALDAIDVRAAGWIAQNRIDEIADRVIVPLDVDLDCARR